MDANAEPITEPIYANRQSIFQRAWWFIRAIKVAGWRYATGHPDAALIVYDPEWTRKPYFVRDDGSLTRTVIVGADLRFYDAESGEEVALIDFGD